MLFSLREYHRRAYHWIICGLVLGVLFITCFPYWPELEHAMLPGTIQRLVGVPTWGCGDSACAAILVRAYPVSLSTLDQTAGITERWCVSYTQVRRHRGRMAPYFRWAYQTGQRIKYVVEKQADKSRITMDYRVSADAFYARFCSF